MQLDATPPVASPNPGVFLFTNAQGTDYVRNNPLRFVDPSGERVELLGNDEEARKKALAVIASGLSKGAESRLRIDSVMENGKTHYYVGVDDGLKSFSKMGEAASDLANLIGAKPTVEFGLTNGVLPGKGAGEAAYTYAPGDWESERTDPPEPGRGEQRQHYDEHEHYSACEIQHRLTQGLDPGVASWHEFGHAWAMWIDMQARRSVIPGASGMEVGTAPGAIQRALDWENRMRVILYGPIGPKNAKR